MKGWQGMEENERVAVTVNRVSTDSAIGRAMD